MTYSYILNLIKETIGEENYNNSKPIVKELINESIETILEGKALINDIKPKTDAEILLLISHHVTTSDAALKGLLKGLFLTDLEPDTVTVNYRGQKVVFHREDLFDQQND